VHNHLAWPLVAAEAASEYKSGRVRTIILVGHSAGADAVANIAARLGQEGIPVKLAISLDPGLSHMPASGHVDHYINYYVSTGIGHTIAKSPQFRGNFRNVDVANLSGIGHFNIDKAAVMEDKVMRDIHAAL
jgi:acetyl esterase/lipase